MENAGAPTLTKGASESVTNGKHRGPNLDQGGQRKRDKWKTPGPQLGPNPDRGGQRKRDKWKTPGP